MLCVAGGLIWGDQASVNTVTLGTVTLTSNAVSHCRFLFVLSISVSFASLLIVICRLPQPRGIPYAHHYSSNMEPSRQPVDPVPSQPSYHRQLFICHHQPRRLEPGPWSRQSGGQPAAVGQLGHSLERSAGVSSHHRKRRALALTSLNFERARISIGNPGLLSLIIHNCS